MNRSDPATAEANWTRHRQMVQGIDHFVLTARLASGGMFGVRGEMRWEQRSDGSFEARITGPFGIGSLTLTGKGTDIEVRTKKGTFRTADPEQWIKDKMGWSFPILGLRYWVTGVPSPHSKAELELGPGGQVAAMQQDGWKLVYTEYQDVGGIQLPRKIEIANTEIRIKVSAERWDEVPVQVAGR